MGAIKAKVAKIVGQRDGRDPAELMAEMDMVRAQGFNPGTYATKGALVPLTQSPSALQTIGGIGAGFLMGGPVGGVAAMGNAMRGGQGGGLPTIPAGGGAPGGAGGGNPAMSASFAPGGFDWMSAGQGGGQSPTFPGGTTGIGLPSLPKLPGLPSLGGVGDLLGKAGGFVKDHPESLLLAAEGIMGARDGARADRLMGRAMDIPEPERPNLSRIFADPGNVYQNQTPARQGTASRLPRIRSTGRAG